VFKFARIACNRVRCTRKGEHGSPLQNINDFVTFIKFVFNK